MAEDRWHISPVVDSLAYHWSWALVLAPSLLFGNRPRDYLMLTIPVLALNFAHRHLTLPVVYLDPDARARFPVRLVVAPVLMFAAFLGPVLLLGTPYRGTLAAGIVAVSSLWGLWHVLQQKYGVLRMYAAKSGLPLEERAPPWVDRWLVNGWLPAWALYLGSHYEKRVVRSYPAIRDLLGSLVETITGVAEAALPFALVFALGAVVAFASHEWRSNRFGNPARLGMGLGVTALSMSFFVVDPIKVALAYTFTHGLEYCVFVWAFERKRFATPSPDPSPLERGVHHPILFYGGFLGLAGVIYMLGAHAFYFFPDRPPPKFLNLEVARWIGFWGMSQAMLHYYYDGFLWKIRNRPVRENL